VKFRRRATTAFGGRLLGAACGIAVLTLVGLSPVVPAEVSQMDTGRTNYLLNCAGCHGLDGVSNSSLVPDLKGQVGFFLNLPEGRNYVAQLPNVAFSKTTDEALAGLLNYVVFSLGGDSAPRGGKPYTVREVSQLRRKPLTGVSLAKMREQMVQILIDQYNATTELRRYGADNYGSPPAPP
jgi:mono/diheme cytochrome c family protein